MKAVRSAVCFNSRILWDLQTACSSLRCSFFFNGLIKFSGLELVKKLRASASEKETRRNFVVISVLGVIASLLSSEAEEAKVFVRSF